MEKLKSITTTFKELKGFPIFHFQLMPEESI
jgi:hypothetical protein